MKKKISRILLIAFFIMFTLTTVGWAEEVELRLMEKSEVFEKWESLSEEEKEKVLVPQYYGIDIKQSVRRSRYNTLLGGSTSLESRFNLAEQYDLIVKDQKLTMSCWAFSTTTMLESNVAMRNVLLNEEYSPLHMEYRATEMYSKPKLGWGSADMALAYMVSGNGPVDESDFPMEDVYDEVNNSYTTHYLTDPDRVNVDLDKTVQLKITDTTTFANIVKKYDTTTGAVQYYDAYETQYTSEQVEAVRKKIKSHIKEYGAVTAGIYSDEDGVLTSTGNYISTYYDSNTDIYAYKVDYTSAESANHQITIVGWDDTKQAYIVQNSWGELFENNGYFYVAYDDVWIESRVYGINNIEELSGNNKYDQIYQYDELGMNYLMGLYVPAIYANVFTRENIPSGKDEYITEVGLYIAETTGIDIYVNAVDGEFTDSNGNTKLKLVHSGEILEPGYHVIKLNASEDTKLIGKQFIIAAKSTNDQGGAIPLEVNLYDTGSTLYSTEYDKATGNPGESFISANNLTNWTDLDGYLLNSIEKFKNSNVCIKAFTKYVEEQSEIPVTGVTVDKTTMIITEGETETLVATVSPDNATNPKVTWTSSNTSIATVSGEGVVTAKSEGTVTITVTTEDGGYTATCSVKVEPKVVSVTDVVLDEDELTIVEGETGKLVATVVPLNATNQNVTWKSSNTSIATVSTDGVVTAVAPGTANITVTTADGNYTATCKVTVTKKVINVTSVTIKPATATIVEGEKATLTATITPSNATNQNVTWTSSNTSVATVSNAGVVTAVSEGTATITVTTGDGGYTATCEVNVTAETISVISVLMVPREKELRAGETATLTATVVPSNATNKNLRWESTDETIATVVGGIVTAHNPGNATIKAISEDGNFEGKCEVTVISNTISVEKVTLNETTKTIKIGETFTLTETITPSNATNKNVTWTSSNQEIAAVSDSGVVNGIKEGTTTITVKTADGGYTATCKVTVEAEVAAVIRVTSVTLNGALKTIKIGETLTLVSTITPSNATNKNVTWTSSNENVATVIGGKVTAISDGKTTITVRTEDGGYTATCEVTVQKNVINVESVRLNKSNEALKEGKTLALTATVFPVDATNKNVEWSSSNEEVAIVSNSGIVTAISDGQTTITVRTEDGGYTATCKITVEKNVIDVESVQLDVENITLKINNTQKMNATILPENATNPDVTWESSNEEIATVSGSGVVTALKPGTVTITVTTVDGEFKDTCKITVTEENISVTGVSLNEESKKIKMGETYTLIETIEPVNATNLNVTWESSNEEVATVVGGVVTALKEGTAIITVTTVDGEFTDTCTITVEDDVINVNGVQLDKEEEELEVGDIIILRQTVLPENATNKNVVWTSSDEEIVIVENGQVTALKEGTATITVETVDGNKTDTCTIVVKEKEESKVEVESIELDKTETTLQVSDKTTLIVRFNPELPSNTKVKWKSSNEKVATVDENGIVRAVGEGETIITVTSDDGGFTAQCKVTVTKQTEDPDDIYKDPNDVVPPVEEPKPDDSIADKDFPNTGLKITYFAIAAVLAVMVISFIKYRKLRDVK